MLPILKARHPAGQRPRPAIAFAALAGLAVLVAVVAGCGAGGDGGTTGAKQKNIVVTYAVLGALVRDAVGDRAKVTVLIPNGADPHDWEPSAKDVERVNKADLIVRNGLDLEGGILDALDRARQHGVATFVASDHIEVRLVGEGEGVPGGDPDQAVGAKDPHLWMDPQRLRDVMAALGSELAGLGIDVADGVASVIAGLEALDRQVADVLAPVPQANRKLVTGHESLGYFAARYGFEVVGAIIPSLTSQAGVSAEALSTLAAAIEAQHVKAIFTEVGTPKQVVEAIGQQSGAKVVELATHNLPADGTYATFLLEDARRVADALA